MMSEIFLLKIESEINLGKLNSKIHSLGISKLGSLVTRGEDLFVQVDSEGYKLSKTNFDKIKKLIDLSIDEAKYDSIRKQRKPLLEEVDWEINKAEDLGEDTIELRKYRQALRDVTNQDMSELKWPEKPWQK